MLKDARISPSIPASDMERAKKFYTEKLGLTPKEDRPDGVTFECGGGTSFLLYESRGAGTNQATYAGWGVKDLEAEMKELRDKGVVFEEYDFPGLKTVNGVATMETGEKAAWFKDSEGNILAISNM